MPIRAYAPASIGNFAAGYDLMGAALAVLAVDALGVARLGAGAALGEVPQPAIRNAARVAAVASEW